MRRAIIINSKVDTHTDLPWRKAIVRVLKDRGSAMHYTEIAKAIIDKGLRHNYGATPANTVSAVVTTEIKDEGDGSAFIKVRRGEFILREHYDVDLDVGQSTVPELDSDDFNDDVESTGIVEALGMYWRRDQIRWNNNPLIMGQQDRKSESVNFADQLGVYLLHDGREVIYVGRSAKRPLGLRLYEHTYDRLNGRWDRFS